MQRRTTILLHLAVAGGLVALDLWSKTAIFQLLDAEVLLREEGPPLLRSGPEIVLFPGFALEAAINLGAFNGMLANMRWLLLSISVVAAVATLVVAAWPRRMPPAMTVALGLIAGGAIGNFYDRVVYGAVRDFVKWYAGDLVWPNFNIADSGIVVGVGLIIFLEIRNTRRERREAARGSTVPEDVGAADGSTSPGSTP